MSAILPNSSHARSLISSGISALNSRDRSRARELLNEAVQLEPENEQAWLWLSGAVDTNHERQRCLEQVLEINPHSEPAKQGLKTLGIALPQARTVVVAPSMETAPPSVPASAEAPTPMTMPAAPAMSVSTSSTNFADWVFGRDTFLLRQKMGINAKYQVWDEYQQPLLYIERPLHMWRTLLVTIGTILIVLVMVVLGLVAGERLPDGPARAIFLSVYMLGTFVLAVAMLVMLSAKRHVTFYRDETKQDKLLHILQDSKFYLINATYTVNDGQGQLLATLRKNHLYDILRKRWYCYAPDGSLMLVAKEDSMLRSVLRRIFSGLGALRALVLPLLRTNFVFLRGEQRLGMFNRKMTLLDRYVLDMGADTGRLIDRRVALALGVMLDTGERR